MPDGTLAWTSGRENDKRILSASREFPSFECTKRDGLMASGKNREYTVVEAQISPTKLGSMGMSKTKKSLNRRNFLKSTAVVSTAAALPTIIPASALGLNGAVAPSERIVLGGIGIGNRGTYDLGCFLQQPDVQFVAVCDIKEKRRTAVKKMADQKYSNNNCEMYRDFRDLLDRDDIDAVLIATGPNWHSTAAMTAAKAGKDMYCEKPVTKNIKESLILAETMQRTARVFQAGTQRRNLPHFAFACELARTGKLGKLKRVYAHPAGMRSTMSSWLPAEQQPDREVVDWDMYLGPAAWRPYNSGCWMASISKRAGDLLAPLVVAGCWSGARTVSIFANGP